MLRARERHLMSAVGLLSVARAQVFAGAVVVIYNVAGVEQLTLTRQLVNGIFVGTVTSW